MVLSELSGTSSSALFASIAKLRGEQRESDVRFLWLLGEIDARSAWSELGYGSTWDYCQRGLHLRGNGSTGRRIVAAQLLREFPVAAEYLLDGRLCITTLARLRPVLTAENHRALFDEASYLNETEVEQLVRARLPESFVKASTVRMLSVEVIELPPSPVRPTALTEPERIPAPSEAHAPLPSKAVVVTPLQSQVRVVDGEYVSLTLKVPKAFMADLEQVTAALGHVVRSREPREVLRECMRRTLVELGKKKGGLPARTDRSRAADQASPNTPGGDVRPQRVELGLAAPTHARSPRRGVDELEPAGAEMSGATPRRGVDDLRPAVDEMSGATPRRGVNELEHAGAEMSGATPRRARRGVDELKPAGAEMSGATPRRGVSEAPGPADEQRQLELCGTRARLVDPRRIPMAVRRAVWERDEGCCAFIGPDGRCRSTKQLEVHHRLAAAWGGPPTVENLALYCRAHNALEARRDFGEAHMSRFTKH